LDEGGDRVEGMMLVFESCISTASRTRRIDARDQVRELEGSLSARFYVDEL